MTEKNKCPVCKTKFEKSQYLKNHDCHYKFYCSYCSKHQMNEQELVTHAMNEHPQCRQPPNSIDKLIADSKVARQHEAAPVKSPKPKTPPQSTNTSPTPPLKRQDAISKSPDNYKIPKTGEKQRKRHKRSSDDQEVGASGKERDEPKPKKVKKIESNEKPKKSVSTLFAIREQLIKDADMTIDEILMQVSGVAMQYHLMGGLSERYVELGEALGLAAQRMLKLENWNKQLADQLNMVERRFDSFNQQQQQQEQTDNPGPSKSKEQKAFEEAYQEIEDIELASAVASIQQPTENEQERPKTPGSGDLM